MIMYYYIRNYYLSTAIYEHFTLTNVSNRYMLNAGTPSRGGSGGGMCCPAGSAGGPSCLAGSCKYDPPNTGWE